MEENFSKILVEELKKLEIHAWILTPACNLAVISKESWPEQYAKKKKKNWSLPKRLANRLRVIPVDSTD